MQNKIIITLITIVGLTAGMYLIYNSQNSIDRELQKLYMQQAENMEQLKYHKEQVMYHYSGYKQAQQINDELWRSIQTYVNADGTMQELVFIEDR